MNSIRIGNPEYKYSKLYLFDLDNTLLINSGYSNNHDELLWFPSSKIALQQLSSMPVNIAVVTNQASISKGIFSSREIINGLDNFLKSSFKNQIRLDSIYVCPHQDSDACNCRKPKPGLIKQAISDFQVAAQNALIFGDAERDILAGSAAGVRAIMVPPGDLYKYVSLEIAHLE